MGYNTFESNPLTDINNTDLTWQSDILHSINHIEWYPYDTGIFITANSNGDISIWDTNELKIALNFALKGNATIATMSNMIGNTSTLIATGNLSNHLLRLCDIRTTTYAHCLIGHQGVIRTCDWSLSSPYQLITGSDDYTIRLWDIRKNKHLFIFDQYNRNNSNDQTINSHNDIITKVKYCPNNLYLFSYGLDRIFHCWDLSTGMNTYRNYGTSLLGNYQQNFDFSLNGDYLINISGQIIRINDVDTGEELKTLKGHYDHINCVVLNSDTNTLYSAGHDATIFVWQGQ